MVRDGVVELSGRSVPYVVVRSERAKYVRLRIGSEPRVEVIVPRRARQPDVPAMLRASEEWVLRHLQRVERAVSETQSLAAGGVLPFLGTDRTLVIQAGWPAFVGLLEDGVSLHVRLPEPSDAGVHAALLSWYRVQARQELTHSAEVHGGRMGVSYTRLTVRDQRTRWGSCSSSGALAFNWRLIMAPRDVLEYVVVHELAHLREMGHTGRFWELVAMHCPEYRAHRRWLKENGLRLTVALSRRSS